MNVSDFEVTLLPRDGAAWEWQDQPGHEGLVNLGKDWVCIPNAMGNHCRALL